MHYNKFPLTPMKIALVFVLVTTFAFSTPALARRGADDRGPGQGPGPGLGGGPGAGPGPGMGGGPNSEMREAIGMAFIVRLKQELNLSREKAFEVYDILDANRQKREALLLEMRQELEKLRSLTESDSPKDADLEAALTAIKTKREALHALEGQVMENLKPVLTPVERAKFVLVYAAFRKRMGHGLGERYERRMENRRQMWAEPDDLDEAQPE